MVSGIYIVEARNMKGGRLQSDAPPKKKTWVDKLQEKAGAKSVK